jgi:serine O-acetyltransferase
VATRRNMTERLVYLQRRPVIGALVHQLLLLLGVDIPREVRIGRDLRLEHRARGVVLHPRTWIGDGVTIFHGVTLGRSEPHTGRPEHARLGFVIKDGAWLGAGAVILSGEETVTVGTGSVIGANSVLTRSTGDHEVWAGVPARRTATL